MIAAVGNWAARASVCPASNAPTLRGAEADLAQAQEMANKLYADEGARGGVRAVALAPHAGGAGGRVNWAAVGTLAQALLVEKVVTGRRARMVVRMVWRVAGEGVDR